MQKKLVQMSASQVMDESYTAGLLHPSMKPIEEAPKPSEAEIEQVVKLVDAEANDGKEEVMVLHKWSGKLLAEAFRLPEMEIEIERAVEQVEKTLKAKEEEVKEAKPGEKASSEEGREVDEKPR